LGRVLFSLLIFAATVEFVKLPNVVFIDGMKAVAVVLIIEFEFKVEWLGTRAVVPIPLAACMFAAMVDSFIKLANGVSTDEDETELVASLTIPTLLVPFLIAAMVVSFIKLAIDEAELVASLTFPVQLLIAAMVDSFIKLANGVIIDVTENVSLFMKLTNAVSTDVAELVVEELVELRLVIEVVFEPA
jgi:hypothetical protein